MKSLELKTIIFNSLKYIETNINEPIMAGDIAENAGYSLYHFSRMFKKQMGLSIMEYVKERKLIKASEEIVNGRKRYSNDDYVTHPINVAILLSEMEASEDTVIAGLLHDIILAKANISLEEVGKMFSNRIANIIKGVTEFNGKRDIIDEDVIMVKLSERLHNMRTIEFMDEGRWKEKAKETLEIFLPIAVKMNNEKLIAELNDLSVKYI